MADKDDWTVSWPDGSWLTWNEETESWEKQDGPPADSSAPGRSTAAKTPTARKGPAPKKTTDRAPAKTAWSTRSATEDHAPTEATPAPQVSAAQPPPVVISVDEGSDETGGAWRPMADAPAAPLSRPRAAAPKREPVVLPRAIVEAQRSLVPAVALGIGLGVATGFLVFFLIR